jgi:hypothetical protein
LGIYDIWGHHRHNSLSSEITCIKTEGWILNFSFIKKKLEEKKDDKKTKGRFVCQLQERKMTFGSTIR